MLLTAVHGHWQLHGSFDDLGRTSVYEQLSTDMGFLKELFEKKLKTSGAYGEDGIEIGRSAQSDWNLPALRQQKTAEYVHNLSI